MTPIEELEMLIKDCKESAVTAQNNEELKRALLSIAYRIRHAIHPSRLEQERTALMVILQEQKQYHIANPAAARAFLLGTGIYTSDGDLTPEYGGPPLDDKGDATR